MEAFLGKIGIRKEEQSRAVLLFIYQFLAVSVLVMGRIVRDTLFLKRYDVKQLPLMYIGVALFVSLLTYFYSKKSAYFRLDVLIKVVMTFSALVMVLILIFVKLQFAFSYPLLYIFVEVMGAFMMFQFWSFANELLDSREAKRVLGFVGVGGILASFAAGEGISLIVKFLSVENVLFLALFFMVATVFIVDYMGRRYRSKLQRSVFIKSPKSFESPEKQPAFSSKYVRNIAFITSFIFISSTLVDYEFKVTSAQTYSEAELAAFFGWIYAVFSGIFSLLFQFFATRRLLKLGVFASLAILPFMMTGFSALFFVFPSIVFISGAKASDYAFRYTINDSAMQLLYIPLQPSLRRKAKAAIDGIVKPLSIGFSGILIYFISRTSIDVRFITAAIVAVGLLWLALFLIIRKQYLAVLMDNIKKKKIHTGEFNIKEDVISSIVHESLVSGNDEEIVMSLDMIDKGRYYEMIKHYIDILPNAEPKIKRRILRLLRKTESRFYSYDVLRMMQDPDADTACEAILTYGFIHMEKSVKHTSSFLKSRNLDIKSAAVISLIRYGGILGIMNAAPYLRDLTESVVPKERVAAAYILGELGQRNMQQKLFSLLNDTDIKVRRAAVKAVGLVGAYDAIPALFFLLNDRFINMDAVHVLAGFGNKILAPAENILSNNLDPVSLKIAVAKVLGSLESPECQKILMISLETRSDDLRTEVLRSLRKISATGAEFNAKDFRMLERTFYKELFNYFQLLYNKQKLLSFTGESNIVDVVSEKQKATVFRIFSILGILYGKEVFDTVYFNLTRHDVTAENRANAIEIIDNIVALEKRKVLIPVIERTEEKELMKIGYDNFKIKNLKVSDILEIMLMDDNPWVRAITLHTIADEDFEKFADKIRNFVYDSSPIVREMAVYALAKFGKSFTSEETDYLRNDSYSNVVKYFKYINKEKF